MEKLQFPQAVGSKPWAAASAQIANQQFEEVRFYRTLARALTMNHVPDFTTCNARIAVDFLHDSKNAS